MFLCGLSTVHPPKAAHMQTAAYPDLTAPKGAGCLNKRKHLQKLTASYMCILRAKVTAVGVLYVLPSWL